MKTGGRSSRRFHHIRSSSEPPATSPHVNTPEPDKSRSHNGNGNNLAQMPRRTGAVALIYDQGGLVREGDNLHGIIVAKNVGPQYGLDTATRGQFDSAPIKSYNQVDLDVGYTFPFKRKQLHFDVNVYNLFNDKHLIGYGGQTVGPPSEALYFTNPGRSIYFS